MSKGTKTTTKPWKEAQPYILGAASGLQGAVNANASQLQANAGLINENLPGLAERAFGNDPTLEAGRGYIGDVLGGKYLDGNPQLDNMVEQTGRSVSDRVNAIFSRAGRTGASAHTGVLGRELGDSENRLRYSDYEAERNRMGQATGQIPGLTAASFAGVDPFLSATGTGSSLPYLGAQTLASGMGGLLGPYSTTTQKPSLGSSLMNAAAIAAQFAPMMSDRRLKTDVHKIAADDDGLGIYTYRYKGDKEPRLGVMAQEVARKRPHALGPKLGDYLTVDYGRL